MVGPAAAGARIAALVGIALLAAAARPAGAQPHPAPPGHVVGRAEAPVEVVEYVDFGCSACAQFAREVWPTIRRDFVDTGRVRWRVVPIDFGFRHGETAGRVAECAAEQDLFWPVHDALFAQRESWSREGRPDRVLVELALRSGVAEAPLRACLDGDGAEARLEAGTDAARGAGLRGTPTFVVNGRLVQGALPLGTFRTLLGVAGGG